MGARRSQLRRRNGTSHLASKLLLESQHLDHQLAQIFASIAHLLLRNGYGFSRVSKLTKIAFVNAAREIDEENAARVSIARIAAVTGLTRIEVSQLLRSNKAQSTHPTEPLNRAARVAIGWLSDGEFCDRLGRPRALPFSASRASFSRLVKRYSGDIPTRAMLAEMKRLKMVRHDSRDVIRMENGRRSNSRQTLSALRAITPWVHFLADIYRGSRKRDLTSSARQLSLKFDSFPQVLAAAREIENRRLMFVDGLKQMGNRSADPGSHELDISIAVAISAAKPKRKRSDP